MHNGICNLCGNNGDLKESHIIPRFVFQWMRKTGGTYFRCTDEPHVRKQDGTKEYLLCGDCEQRFSIREAYFKSNIFDPFHDRDKRAFDYDEKLFYFLISVSWRVLVRDMADPNITSHRYYKDLVLAEAEWRKFLITESPPATFNETHLFLSDLISGGVQPVRRMNLYNTRAVDGTIVSSNKLCALYWKFTRFISFTAITPFDQSEWTSTRVNPAGGTLTTPQHIKDESLGEFLVDRARIMAEDSKDMLNAKQREFHLNKIRQDPDAFLKSDLWKAYMADATNTVDPHILYPKVGRNERCPCGSGQKYKKCHGS